MRLVEFFELLEAKDRLEYLADKNASKIFARWKQKVNDEGMTGLPQDWIEAIADGIIPDAMTMEQFKDLNDLAQRHQDMPKWVVDFFAQFDPSKNNKYTDWILRQWLSDKLWLEDTYKLTSTLETFEEHRKKLGNMDILDRNGDPLGPPPERRGDINAWKDYRTLFHALRPLQGTTAAGEKVSNFLAKDNIQKMMHIPVPDPVSTFGPNGEHDIDEIQSDYAEWAGKDGGEFDTHDWYDFVGSDEDTESTTEIKPIYKSDRLAVLQPNTRRAACELGRGTEWCTASTSSHNHFWNYAPSGPLYVILTDKMGKYQFHFDSGQFADVHDNMLSDEQKAELANAYPELRKIFADEAVKHGQLWLIDPAMITSEYLENIQNDPDIYGPYSREARSRLEMLMQKIPKAFDGKADEKALRMAEEWLRKNKPEEAWRYVRKPTEQDFLDGIQSMPSDDIRQVTNTWNIMNFARQNNIELSDEVYEAAVASDSESILSVTVSAISRNPQWVLAAVKDQPRFVEMIYATLFGDSQYDIETERAQVMHHALMSLDGGKELIMNALYNRPTMVRWLGNVFGIDPWKHAFKIAHVIWNDHSVMNQLRKILETQNFSNEELVDLLMYLFDINAINLSLVKTIEHKLGGSLPLQLQKKIVQENPLNIQLIGNPDPNVLKIAQAMVKGNSELSSLRRAQ